MSNTAFVNTIEKFLGEKIHDLDPADLKYLTVMFRDIQKTLESYHPAVQKDFLNSSYVIHKFCELLELDDYLEYFPMPMIRSKLDKYDDIWKNVCVYMNWRFYRSVQ
jgi:hypothetical protein